MTSTVAVDRISSTPNTPAAEGFVAVSPMKSL
jgi:hypothetical protein